MPYLYQSQVDDLRLINKVQRTVRAAPLRHAKAECLPIAIEILGACMKRCTEELRPILRKIVSDLELEKHRRDGHDTFMAECPECRQGAIQVCPHRRQGEERRPGGELSLDPIRAALAWPLPP